MEASSARYPTGIIDHAVVATLVTFRASESENPKQPPQLVIVLRGAPQIGEGEALDQLLRRGRLAVRVGATITSHKRL